MPRSFKDNEYVEAVFGDVFAAAFCPFGCQASECIDAVSHQDFLNEIYFSILHTVIIPVTADASNKELCHILTAVATTGQHSLLKKITAGS